MFPAQLDRRRVSERLSCAAGFLFNYQLAIKKRVLNPSFSELQPRDHESKRNEAKAFYYESCCNDFEVLQSRVSIPSFNKIHNRVVTVVIPRRRDLTLVSLLVGN